MDPVGFIVINFSGTLVGTVSSGRREVLHKLRANLPGRRGRVGGGTQRYIRIRRMKRQRYLKEVAEMSALLFTHGKRLAVSGLVVAGVERCLDMLVEALDARLAANIMKLVVTSCGGESGFDDAVDLAAEEIMDTEVMQDDRERYTHGSDGLSTS